MHSLNRNARKKRISKRISVTSKQIFFFETRLITKQSPAVPKVSLKNITQLKPQQVLKRILAGHIPTLSVLGNISPQNQQSQSCNAYEEATWLTSDTRNACMDDEVFLQVSPD